jgi:hypothetical protein
VFTHGLWRWHKGIPLINLEFALLWKHDMTNAHSPQLGRAFIGILPHALVMANHMQALG